MAVARRGLIAALALLLAGCAVMAEENRRTLNAMDEHVAPESSAARWALAPVALPAGLVGLTADLVIVHPATAIDDAWGDTVEVLWTPRDNETGFRRAVMAPVALTVASAPAARASVP